jgi:hypothetical protein
LDLYKKYANILIEKGFAYPDPYTEKEIEDCGVCEYGIWFIGKWKKKK